MLGEKNLEDKVIYIIGSLKNWKVIDLANHLREEFPDCEVFDSWISPGPEADDYWRDYSKKRNLSYREALKDWSATHIFEFDKTHLDRSNVVIMYMPCGRSGHLELGYSLGQGKKGYVFFDDEPNKGEVIYKLPNGVFTDLEELEKELKTSLELNVKHKLPTKKIIETHDPERICLINSLSNEKSRMGAYETAKKIEDLGFEVVGDWNTLGPENFNPVYLEECDRTILYMPDGKIGHLEVGYAVGKGRKGYILFDEEPKRWDIMYQFCDEIFFNFNDLEKELLKNE